MGTLRIIAPTGDVSEIGYDGKEAPIGMLQKACGGYVEHYAVQYEGKRRSAYMVDPWSRHPELGRPKDLRKNETATKIVGQNIRGPLVIDLSADEKFKAGPKPGGVRLKHDVSRKSP